ncbi:hypothetical protein AVEN_223530-1 [Araneus ventricosus]|uniref:Uncharacterized protein n=1 Tax=Araneus ventricosus TaxID=182803 RepID=A0A4Y2DGK3_ARAVE|nr:hypothetical protein AVEN_223530-1 [Araneus ventricosus]
MDWKWWNSKELTNSKSKAPSVDSNLGPRRDGSGNTKDLRALGPRVEARNETRIVRWKDFWELEPCLKINFGIFRSDLPNF